MTESIPLMRLKGVGKRFGEKVIALRGVDMQIERGKVHGLLGANGAGKSTLIKILSGAFRPTSGTIEWQGQPVTWATPREANDNGVATIHQHIPLIPSLSVLENVYLGEGGLWRQSSKARARFQTLCDQLDYDIEPDVLVGDLRIGQRQMVAILQALGTGADLIIMDEPTASLAAEERELVYRIVRHLSQTENKAVLFVSHFLDEIMALTDRITVLRDGVAAMEAVTSDLDEAQIAEAIVGRQIVALERAAQEDSAAQARHFGDVVLSARGLTSAGRFSPLDLDLRAGEVVGLVGLLGSGRSEILHALYRADPAAQGTVTIAAQELPNRPAAAVEAGMALVPEDRNAQGLFGNFELWRNVTLPDLQGNRI